MSDAIALAKIIKWLSNVDQEREQIPEHAATILFRAQKALEQLRYNDRMHKAVPVLSPEPTTPRKR